MLTSRLRGDPRRSWQFQKGQAPRCEQVDRVRLTTGLRRTQALHVMNDI